MIVDSRSRSEAARSSVAISAGRLNNCPICEAYFSPRPKVGDRLLLLDEFRVGLVGTVTNTTLDESFRPGTFLLHADDAPQDWTQIVDPESTLFLRLPFDLSCPDWFPPFSLNACLDLHLEIVLFVDSSFRSGEWQWRRTRYNEVISYCWQKRLPIEPSEVWQMLRFHGAPPSAESESMRLFEEGVELLVYTNGRRPIKKKRILEARRSKH